MKAYVIKSKEGKYLDDTQQQPFFVTEDICKTRLYKTFEKAREICSKKINCEVVEITIAEGNLGQEIEEYNNYFKSFGCKDFAEFQRLIGLTKISANDKERDDTIRKQVCDEIRNAIDNENYELWGDNNRILSIQAKDFNAILDKIEKGESDDDRN